MNIKLNLGSHNKKIGDDWINIDGLDLPNVDGVCDLNETPFIISVKSFEKIKNIDLILIKHSSVGTSFDKKEIKINDNSIDEIQMVEVLEHISFRNIPRVLKEIHRILKPGGKLHIQVPDCGKAMKYYINKEICNCVPHKSTGGDSNGNFKANKNCIECEGKAKINPMRWLFSFTGAQKHEFDAHLMIFTRESLLDALNKSGFTNVQFKDDIYKLKVNTFK